MRKLWTSNNWNEYISEKSRPGIRLKFDKNVDPEVKRACKQYVNWLRTQYYFPIRVPIYLKSSCEIISCAGEKASASFLAHLILITNLLSELLLATIMIC